MRKRIELQRAEAGDAELIQSLLDWKAKTRADFTNTFRDLWASELPDGDPDFRAWQARWQERFGREGEPMTVVAALMRTAR